MHLSANLDQCCIEIQRKAAGQAPLGAWGGIVSAHQYRCLFEMTERVLSGDERVLDWGCGRGYWSYCLLRNGFRVDALDFQAIGLVPELTRSSPGAFQFSLAPDATTLPYEDSTFDVVTSVGVLEHVRVYGGDERASLRELHRIVRPGGHLLCVHFPSNRAWPEAAARRFRRNAHCHEYRYSAQDVERLLGDTEWALEQVFRYGSFPRNPLAHLPMNLKNSVRLAQMADVADRAGTWLMGSRAQNIAFVAQKR